MLVATKEAPQRARPAQPAPAKAPEVARETAAEPAPAPRQAETPADAAAQPSISARRRESAGPRLVTLPTIAPAAPPEADASADFVPKPRRSAALDALIRNRAPLGTALPQTEEDLMAALGAIAAGDR